MAGRYWNSAVEWDIHYPLAIKAGVSPTVLSDLSLGKEPVGMSSEEALIYELTNELRRTKAVSDATYAKALTKFGEKGMIELIAIAGHYDIVCMTLSVAQVSVPSDSTVPRLADLH